MLALTRRLHQRFTSLPMATLGHQLICQAPTTCHAQSCLCIESLMEKLHVTSGIWWMSKLMMVATYRQGDLGGKEKVNDNWNISIQLLVWRVLQLIQACWSSGQIVYIHWLAIWPWTARLLARPNWQQFAFHANWLLELLDLPRRELDFLLFNGSRQLTAV